MSSNLTPTQAAYLVAVYELEKEHRVARVGSIAKALKVGLSSVSAALKTLADKKLLNYSPHSYITLTGEGLNLGKELTERKIVLYDFLHDTLALSPADADRNAHRLERAIDDKTYDRLLDFINFINTCPRAGEEWRAGFKNVATNPWMLKIVNRAWNKTLKISIKTKWRQESQRKHLLRPRWLIYSREKRLGLPA